MRALISRSPGGPETLELGELADPSAGEGEVLVRVRACAVNFPDVLIIEDKYQFRPERPFAPGGEIAGEIEVVGPGVTGWQVGDRVFGWVLSNGMAELAKVKASDLFRLPAHRSFAEGASILLTYGTAIHALLDRGQARAGEKMLVLGASGGVGVAAIEIGKALGLQVIAAVSSDEKAVFARSVGADETVIYGRGPLDRDASKTLANVFKQAVGSDGAQIVFDPVGGDYAEPALRSLGWEGRYLVVGFPAGIPKLPLNLTLLKSCDIRGVFWGAFVERSPDANRANIDRLMAMWDAGQISPRITATYSLARGGEAIAAMSRRAVMGKIVVLLDD